MNRETEVTLDIFDHAADTPEDQKSEEFSEGILEDTRQITDRMMKEAQEVHDDPGSFLPKSKRGRDLIYMLYHDCSLQYVMTSIFIMMREMAEDRRDSVFYEAFLQFLTDCWMSTRRFSCDNEFIEVCIRSYLGKFRNAMDDAAKNEDLDSMKGFYYGIEEAIDNMVSLFDDEEMLPEDELDTMLEHISQYMGAYSTKPVVFEFLKDISENIVWEESPENRIHLCRIIIKSADDNDWDYIYSNDSENIDSSLWD